MTQSGNTRILLSISIAAAGLVSCGSVSPPAGISKTTLVREQQNSDSTTVVAGPEYEAGWLHRLFFGDHYRDLWDTPVTVEVLDMAQFAGGLTPAEAGGGFQTKSLRFTGADGRVYKFRSVDKNPRAVLPLELRETVAGDLAQDHISTSHPCATLIVDHLAPVAGLPHLESRLVYLPYSDLLGEYQTEFGGLLGIFELYPEDNDTGNPDFYGARKIENTLKMFEAMEEDSRDRPDAEAFLKARFLDVFVGDWDRHVKQWKWARSDVGERKMWYPIPMDRDQAMVRLDGLFTSIAGMAITQFSDFTGGVPDIYKLTFSGQYLDRRILSGLGKDRWDTLAHSFVKDMTDERIEDAVRRIPPEYFSIDGDRIAQLLRSRRDAFAETASGYYELLAEEVDIHLSDKREFVRVYRMDDGRVDVRAWKRDKGTGFPVENEEVFHRMFDPSETEEIRLYVLGGDDKVVVSGESGSSIPVRVIGGTGDDELVDQSRVSGALWGFLPFTSVPAAMTFFYDHKGDNTILAAEGTCVDTGDYKSPQGGVPQY